MKKILVIGSGGREHAIVWKLSASPEISKIYCAPGNGGISHLAECIPILADDIISLADFAEKESIDLTIVGPEAPLSMGIVDFFRQRGLHIFGPDSRAAERKHEKFRAKAYGRIYEKIFHTHR